MTGKCPDFVSNELVVGRPQTMSRISLSNNGKCTLMVDASSVVGRVTINASKDLGVLVPGYVSGQPITVPRGSVKYITLYNGYAYGGPISFTLTFSGATTLITSTSTLILAAFNLM